ELAALPACKPFESANPKSPVARREKLVNRVRRELLTRWRLPRDVPDAIEPKQTKFRSQPEIPVRRLGNAVDHAFGKAFANLPRRVRVLAHVQLRIERERARMPPQQHGSQHNAERESVSSSFVRSLHNAYVLRFSHPICDQGHMQFLLDVRWWRSAVTQKRYL